mmetsp:Transcript_27799/g.66983  ORF Transcript_27799/g.66983 Transcript_27799/m.66983 type:complete len:205 (-) Transcript_27799:586-1200(-)
MSINIIVANVQVLLPDSLVTPNGVIILDGIIANQRHLVMDLLELFVIGSHHHHVFRVRPMSLHPLHRHLRPASFLVVHYRSTVLVELLPPSIVRPRVTARILHPFQELLLLHLPCPVIVMIVTVMMSPPERHARILHERSGALQHPPPRASPVARERLLIGGNGRLHGDELGVAQRGLHRQGHFARGGFVVDVGVGVIVVALSG